MLKRLRLLSILMVMTIGSADAQQASFDVASVKRSLADPGLPRVRNVLWPPGGRMTATGVTVSLMKGRSLSGRTTEAP